ncbi:MAG: arsenate reductase (glutaredoxin) [Pseudomonadales bacterium]|nr:arsenate reductase (glutaredoxin) [Pseudomonadales bacterium]
MSEITIYHNPRCSKSRAALALLEENDITPNIVYYLDTPPTEEQLQALLSKLGMGIRDILRRSEAEYDEFNLGDSDLNEEIIFDIVRKHPKLIERPIVVRGDRAIIGRPPENVLQLLDD